MHTICTKTTQMPLDPISNKLEARITVASKLKEDIIFSCMWEYHVLPHLRCFGDTSSSEPLDLWSNNSSVVWMFFLQKSPQRVRPLLTSTKTAQMPLDLRSNDLEARITVPSKPREHLMFSRTGEYEVLPHRRFYGVRVHWDLMAHSRRFECFCNIRLIEFGKCAESTSTTHVASDHRSYDLDAHITVAAN